MNGGQFSRQRGQEERYPSPLLIPRGCGLNVGPPPWLEGGRGHCHQSQGPTSDLSFSEEGGKGKKRRM